MNLEGRWNWRVYFNGNLTKSWHTSNLQKYERFLLKFPFTNFKPYKIKLSNTYIKYIWGLFTFLLIFVGKSRRQANHIFNSTDITMPDVKIWSIQTNSLNIMCFIRKMSRYKNPSPSANYFFCYSLLFSSLPIRTWHFNRAEKGPSNVEFYKPYDSHTDGKRFPKTFPHTATIWTL